MSVRIAGYADRIAASPGDIVRFMVHGETPLDIEADLVRVVYGDPRPARGGPVLQDVAADFAGAHRIGPQPIASGGYGLAEATQPVELSSWTLACLIQPTRFGRAQALMGFYGPGKAAVRLGLDAGGRLMAQVGETALLTTNASIPLNRWSFVSLACDGETGALRLHVRSAPQGPGEAPHVEVAEGQGGAPLIADTAVFAARRVASDAGVAFDERLDGKLEAPTLMSGVVAPGDVEDLLSGDDDARIVAQWDFAQAISSREIVERTGGWRGELHNLPSRAVRGFRWDGTCHDWRVAADHYAAIHFHSDAQYDMGWSETFRWAVPSDLPSGAYAARLRHGDETAYVMVFVEPPAGTSTADVVFLASTATYLAYANETVHLRLAQSLTGVRPPVSPEYELLLKRPQFGGSLYEHHLDGAGVRYSSYLRPIANMRPLTRMWSFNADTAILKWLEREAPGFDLVTDHRLHGRGVEALNGARVVVTGTHPEYYSDEMLDALEAFLARGGRLIYMGGNGFYWRTAFSSEWPGAIEVRRAEDGTRAWIEEPGEYLHAFDGRLGGLWRRNGRPPNRLVGVGFAAQGFGSTSHYRLSAAARDPRVAFALEGISGEVIGDDSAAGPAGEEIDRFDIALGSPAHGLVIASSEGLGADMLRVKEEFHASTPHYPDPAIRADATFFETAAGGAVFSTGSIAWAGAMAAADFNNDVARLTLNVLRRFRDPTPFVFPARADQQQMEKA